jgi:ferritin
MEGAVVMLNEKIEKAFNKQINAELYSGYLYLSMSACFESLGLKGFANWMRVQAQEEQAHAMKFFAFVNDRGGQVLLDAIEKPPAEWTSPLAAFEAVYEHECKVSGLINDLVNLATGERDHASQAFLQWFVTEQVEEEASAAEIVDQLKMIGESGGALLMMDHKLGERVAAAASSEAS